MSLPGGTGKKTHFAVIGHVADEQHQPVPCCPRGAERFHHQRFADSAGADGGSTVTGPSSSAGCSPQKIGVTRLAPTSKVPTRATKERL